MADIHIDQVRHVVALAAEPYASRIPEVMAQLCVEVRVHSCAAAFCKDVRDTSPSVVILYQPDALSTDAVEGFLPIAGRASPRIIFCLSGSNCVRAIAALVSCGHTIDIVTDLQASTVARALASGDEAQSRAARRAILRCYHARVGSGLEKVILAAICLGLPRHRARDLATTLRMSNRTLQRHILIHAFRGPTSLLCILTCLHVVWLIEFSALPLKRIANMAGFSMPQAMSHFFTRHLGVPPVRAAGNGFAQMTNEWLDRLIRIPVAKRHLSARSITSEPGTHGGL